jgi:hypothetical protein
VCERGGYYNTRCRSVALAVAAATCDYDAKFFHVMMIAVILSWLSRTCSASLTSSSHTACASSFIFSRSYTNSAASCLAQTVNNTCISTALMIEEQAWYGMVCGTMQLEHTSYLNTSQRPSQAMMIKSSCSEITMLLRCGSALTPDTRLSVYSGCLYIISPLDRSQRERNSSTSMLEPNRGK